MAKALIIVDPQNDFCEGGPLAIANSNKIFPQINRLRQKINFDHVFITLDWHPADHSSFARNHNQADFSLKNINGENQVLWPVHCVQNTEGANPSKLLNIERSDIFIKKGQIKEEEQYSGFGTKKNETELESKLRELNVQQVIVVGLALDYCVGSTALDAKNAGFQVTVIEQCTKSVNEETGSEKIRMFQKNGIKFTTMDSLSIQNF